LIAFDGGSYPFFFQDLLIQEKEKLYVELKNILARQPGPEIVEELSRLQLLLKEKVPLQAVVVESVVSCSLWYASVSNAARRRSSF
jgi:hypothetical protein